MILPQHGVLHRRNTPLVPPSFDVVSWSAAGVSTAARQTSLEPGSGGVDVAMSWSGWFNWHNVNINTTNTIMSNCSSVTAATQQYALQLVGYGTATDNGKLIFAIFNTAGDENIRIISSNRINRSRFTHIVVTYSGSETPAGLTLYINGVEDTGAQKLNTGYTGCGSSSGYRFGINNAVTARKCAGKMRDLCVWNRVITSSEVLELFNGGAPIDVNTLSFYAGAIIAYYPLRSNNDCLNNSALNIAAGLSYQSVPISPTYGEVSMFNGVPGNTRYVAFGKMFPVNGQFMWIGRSGTSHLAGGKIVQFLFNGGNTMSVNNPPTDIIPFSTEDLRTGTAGIVNGAIQAIICREDGTGTILGNDQYDSTDGLVGQTYGAPVAVTTPVTLFLTYSRIYESYTPSEYNCMAYGVNGANSEVYWGTYASGSWTWATIYSATSPQLNECAVAKIGNNSWLAICRSSSSAFLYQSVSTDGGANWSSFTATNLSVTANSNMAALAVTGNGSRVACLYTDKGNDLVMLSTGNLISSIVASASNWNAGGAIWQNYSGTPQFLVGYPSIVADPLNPYYGAVAVSGEASATRADLIFGYGIIDFTA